MGLSISDVVVVADDLSGAAESAAALARFGHGPVPVLLDGTVPEASSLFLGPVVIDTNSRALAPEDAADACAGVRRSVEHRLRQGRRTVVVKKIDSLLRGNITAEIRALSRQGALRLLAPALPSAGRIVRDGEVWVDGRPLAETPAWRLESHDAPRAVSKTISSRACRVFTLPEVRTGPAAADVAALDLAVFDGETADDVASAARFGLSLEGEVLLIGSAALVEAVAALADVESAAPGGRGPRTPARATERPRRLLFVVGSAEPSASRQVDALERAGVAVVRAEPRELLASADAVSRAVQDALAGSYAVAVTTTGGHVGAADRARLVQSLATAVSVATDSGRADTAFLATGGQTARALLDSWGTRILHVTGGDPSGVAWGTTDDGVQVLTRPGSFGADDDLVRVLRAVHEMTADPSRTGERNDDDRT